MDDRDTDAEEVLRRDIRQENQEEADLRRIEQEVEERKVRDEAELRRLEERRSFEIIVNAERKVVHHEKISFEEITHIAFPAPEPGTDPRYTVTFSKAAGPPEQGTLTEGKSVDVRNGTIFSVKHTNKS